MYIHVQTRISRHVPHPYPIANYDLQSISLIAWLLHASPLRSYIPLSHIQSNTDLLESSPRQLRAKLPQRIIRHARVLEQYGLPRYLKFGMVDFRPVFLKHQWLPS